MAELLLLFLACLPFVVPGAALVAAGSAIHNIVVCLEGDRGQARAVWTNLVVFGFCVALAAYGTGFFSGGLFYLGDKEDLCVFAGDGYAFSPAPSSFFPLRNPICLHEGQRVDLVPAFVNPVVCSSLILVVTSVVALVFTPRARPGTAEESG